MAQQTYPPLALLRRITAKYPSAWEEMEMFHNACGSPPLPKWESWCYAPMAAAYAITMQDLQNNFENRMAVISDMQCIAALAPWRLSKEVYVIDPELQALLFDQADDLELDSEILLHLPYPCFYIQFSPAVTWNGIEYHGVFVHLEHDTITGDKELRLLYLSESGRTYGQPVHIESGTVAQSILRTRTEAYENLPPDQHEYRRALMLDDRRAQMTARFYSQTVQLVLYLCAQNAEIAPNSEQAFVTRRSKTGEIKDRYAEIRKWDVGTRIGNAVRAYRRSIETPPEPSAEKTPGTHASPRPHLRRGHWHNFWTGSKNAPADRKLILKWVAPTFVSTAGEEETPIVLHHAKFSKDDQENTCP